MTIKKTKSKNRNSNIQGRKTRKGGSMFSSLKKAMSKLPGARTLANMMRKADKYGHLPLVNFYCAIMSRLAYFDEKGFIYAYTNIMGEHHEDNSVEKMAIFGKTLRDIINVGFDEDKSKVQTFLHSNDWHKDGDFKKDKKAQKEFDLYSIANQVNEIVIQVENILVGQPINKGEELAKCEAESKDNGGIKVISVAWSYYGNVYIVADRNMPNVIQVFFRGSYSAKTVAAWSSTKNIRPLITCPKDSEGKPVGYLYGAFSIASQMSHTIIEAMKYLTENNGMSKKTRLLVTGHSFGGALATVFAGLFTEAMQTPEYSNYPFQPEPVCITLGSPKVHNHHGSEKFCKLVFEDKILYQRNITRGDPAPMGPKTPEYAHPCDKGEAHKLEKDGLPIKQLINTNCNPTSNSLLLGSLSGLGSKLMSKRETAHDNKEKRLEERDKKMKKSGGAGSDKERKAHNSKMLHSVQMNNKKNLDCQVKRPRMYMANPFSYLSYLHINYITAVSLGSLLGSAFTKETKEVSYTKDKETVCRIVYMEAHHAPPGQCLPVHIKGVFLKYNELLTKEAINNEDTVKNLLEEGAQEVQDPSNTDGTMDTTNMLTTLPSEENQTPEQKQEIEEHQKEEEATLKGEVQPPVVMDPLKDLPQDVQMTPENFTMIMGKMEEFHDDDGDFEKGTSNTLKDWTNDRRFRNQVKQITISSGTPMPVFTGCLETSASAVSQASTSTREPGQSRVDALYSETGDEAPGVGVEGERSQALREGSTGGRRTRRKHRKYKKHNIHTNGKKHTTRKKHRKLKLRQKRK